MDWLINLFRRPTHSAEIAKNRLKVVLSYDRTNLTPELLGTLQDEIVSVISRHLEIDRAGMTVSTQRGDGGDHLVADIPIRSFRPAPPAPKPATPTTMPAPAKKRQKHK
jgi:cell division topological specificity factor